MVRKKRKKLIIQQELEPEVKIRKKRFKKASVNIGKLISDYLIHSYLYYELNEPVISDNEYDLIINSMLTNFNKIEESDHIHKHLIDKKALESYTGFFLTGNFPEIVKFSALGLLYPEKSINELLKEV